MKIFGSENRFKTESYVRDGEERSFLFEKTKNGVLVTELDYRNLVLNQIYTKSENIDDTIREFVSKVDSNSSFEYVERGIQLKYFCKYCDSATVVRELDTVDLNSINDVPVVPMFACTSCKKRFYNMTDTYLKNLVSSKVELFENVELDEQTKNEDTFIKELQEYIIRIYAAKKIERLYIKT